jgi:hypothetical protein
VKGMSHAGFANGRVQMPRAAWDFEYAPIARCPSDSEDDTAPCDAIVATSRAVDVSVLEACVAAQLLSDNAIIEVLVARAPLFWFRVRSPLSLRRDDLARALVECDIPVRYVASACEGSLAAPEPLDIVGAALAEPTSWSPRGVSPKGAAEAVRSANADDGFWFLDSDGGVSVERANCGTGAGTRFAVVDDDAADAELLDLDALVPVGIAEVPSAHSHGPLMVAWAAAARRGRESDSAHFVGVAPDASPRLYCVPKPGTDVVSLAVAIARAVFDGADVVVCATYVEGTMSPMLDDALEIAARLGRRGCGTAVVFPTGRETSSPEGSLHASLSLSLGDPASDPRVTCIAPGGRTGGWFFWKDRSGKYRPFANRGPAVRWLSPGDDVAYPFASAGPGRLFHAESSGASAIAAGVFLLVMAVNPTLTLAEIDEIFARTSAQASGGPDVQATLADPADALPRGADADGHDAKHGYGRLDATRACLAASDPIAFVLVTMGEVAAAARVRELRGACGEERLYSMRVARWAVRAILSDARADHALRVVLRHARLVAVDRRRAVAHPKHAFTRQLLLTVRALVFSPLGCRIPAAVAKELGAASRTLAASTRGLHADGVERALIARFTSLFRTSNTVDAPSESDRVHRAPAFG